MSVYDPRAELPDPTLDEIQVAARRELVKEMLVRRTAIAEIVSTLGTSLRTVRRDVAAIRQQLADSLTEKDALAIASDFMVRSDARQRELWALYGNLTETDVPTINAKVAILRELRAESVTEVDLLQKLGIVYQAPREILTSVAAVAALRQVPEDKLGELAALPQVEFLKQLESYIGAAKFSELIDTPALTDGENP